MDPELLTPVQCVRRDMAMQQQSETNSQSNASGPESDTPFLSGGQPVGNLQPSSGIEPSLQAMVAHANTAKMELELTPRYAALLDKYINVS